MRSVGVIIACLLLSLALAAVVQAAGRCVLAELFTTSS